MTTSVAGTGEFEKFGPWIDEVRTPADVPPLFRSYPLDLTSTALVLKVPRSIHRRDATADMDLYDHMLVLDDIGLTALSRRTDGDRHHRRGTRREPGSYTVWSVRYVDVAAVQDSVSLLDASFTVLSRAGDALTVRYNGSARASVQRLVDALRVGTTSDVLSRAGGALREAGRYVATETTAVVLPQDQALVSNLREAQRGRPALAPWAWHGRSRVSRRAGGIGRAVARITDAVNPVTLHGAILASDGVALEVLGRRDPLTRGTMPDHSASHLVVALNTLETVTIEGHASFDGVVTAGLVLGGARLELQLPEGSPAHHLLYQAAAATTS
ncbi:hypothetical protein C8046_01450 [Serinibacter arcticus]|uniref:Uncharacterized protein n=1 Tax=Serinibacter arcticus TaxID=1655435 RepID=A0A2U1ZRI0_9MICO|nr:hypothetical protein [Serinibacter arcticus]PWD49576.1 hypothetical protein C8046_01450 [Serinibacter arcticus]